MISFKLCCESGHGFEAWFRGSDDYDRQARSGLLECPSCGSTQVEKALMSPSVAARKGDSVDRSEKVALSAGHPEQAKIREMMRKIRQKVTSEAEYVGDRFAEEARKIHFHEAEARGIYGEASREEARSLAEDGVEFMPLPNVPEEHN